VSAVAVAAGVLAQATTSGGETVNVSYLTETGDLIADCFGCDWWGRRNTGALTTDTPEQETARVNEWLPAVREIAQAHAAACWTKTGGVR
jgi:hypothetical protein